jgi:translocation and assembly module TamA
MTRVRGKLCCLWILLAGWTGCLSLAHAADPQSYKVDIASTGNGAMDSTIKATSELASLRKSAPVDPFGLIARARGDVSRLKTVLESHGYYQGSVTITINGMGLDQPALSDALSALPKGQDAQCLISFNLGPQYRIGSVEIDGSIPESARGTLGLATGQPAVASDVLAGAARLLTSLQNQSYAFAKVDPPVAYKDSAHQVLNLSFHVTTGPAVQIGEIQLAGLKRLTQRFVRRRLLLHTGQPYSAIAVESARKDLVALGVFSTVDVQLGSAPDSQARVPVTFQLREKQRYALGANAAYSSDLGASAGVTWTDRNVRGNAEQLELSAQVINLGGTATTGIGYNTSARYTLPEFAHRDQSLQFAVGALKQALEAYDQQAQTAGITLNRKLSSIWRASAGISATHETIIQEGDRHVYTLFSLPLNVLYDTTDLPTPLADPTHGLRASLNLAPTVSRGEPNSTFFVTQGSLAGYVDMRWLFHGDPGRSVLALRALGGSAFGATRTNELVDGQVISVPELPPDQRFYAGGSGTVRGYRYQSVGPEFPDGNPVGGLAMTALNAEFRQRFATSLGAVMFVDAGQVSETLNPFSALFHGHRCSETIGLQSTTSCWAVGVGVGARYYTAIGPVRLDFAVPTLRRPHDDRFEVYIGLGQAF